MTTEAGRKNGHSDCFFCGAENTQSLKLAFIPSAGDGVTASFQSRLYLQGYPGLMHGGIVAGLLDCAMTHCLFQHGILALTAELKVRYIQPVPYDALVEISASPVSLHQPVLLLRAEMASKGHVLAKAEAKFMRRQGAAQ